MSLTVLDPGLQTLLVDGGRPRFRSLGVPVGGPADRVALALGNGLVGNPPDAPALEICLSGPTIRAEHSTGVVVFGAPFALTCGDHRFRAGTTFTLRAGEVLRIGGTPTGARAYLCVPGGFGGVPVLESVTGLEPLTAGTVLESSPSELPKRALPPEATAQWRNGPVALRMVPGPQADWFAAGAFESGLYTVSAASNRMGLRLTGEALTRPLREMISEPVAPGTVQVTNEGQSIVLGVDGQTIGGYPKVGHVIRADLDWLGRLRPGDAVRFEVVTVAEAEAVARTRAEWLRGWLTRLAVAVG